MNLITNYEDGANSPENSD